MVEFHQGHADSGFPGSAHNHPWQWGLGECGLGPHVHAQELEDPTFFHRNLFLDRCSPSPEMRNLQLPATPNHSLSDSRGQNHGN